MAFHDPSEDDGSPQRARAQPKSGAAIHQEQQNFNNSNSGLHTDRNEAHMSKMPVTTTKVHLSPRPPSTIDVNSVGCNNTSVIDGPFLDASQTLYSNHSSSSTSFSASRSLDTDRTLSVEEQDSVAEFFSNNGNGSNRTSPSATSGEDISDSFVGDGNNGKGAPLGHEDRPHPIDWWDNNATLPSNGGVTPGRENDAAAKDEITQLSAARKLLWWPLVLGVAILAVALGVATVMIMIRRKKQRNCEERTCKHSLVKACFRSRQGDTSAMGNIRTLQVECEMKDKDDDNSLKPTHQIRKDDSDEDVARGEDQDTSRISAHCFKFSCFSTKASFKLFSGSYSAAGE